MAVQQVEFAKNSLHYEVGTGKDAKIFVQFLLKKNNNLLVYNIPLLTLNSIQIWTSMPKMTRYAMGDANPQALTTGIKSVAGFITATIPNESISHILRRTLTDYKPSRAIDLDLDLTGIVTLDELDKVTYLDQLPPCQIKIFMSNPKNKKVFSKTLTGVEFTKEGFGIGTSPSMSSQFSFIAREITPTVLEEIEE